MWIINLSVEFIHLSLEFKSKFPLWLVSGNTTILGLFALLDIGVSVGDFYGFVRALYYGYSSFVPTVTNIFPRLLFDLYFKMLSSQIELCFFFCCCCCGFWNSVRVRKGSLAESLGKGFHQLSASPSVIFFLTPISPCNPPRINFSAWCETQRVSVFSASCREGNLCLRWDALGQRVGTR